ncbi:hypothetical protein [Yinghuangia seranimata]|uniref:hypothetical protein n=1 Tax=Yinghuangia seranimata TaxID=408067 RepID=UPI00248C8DED|nr:hypothetical protein [Yinghuangia seranimata]MDI2132505.1 hypothetical protein [Yinghuangia seranimata]
MAVTRRAAALITAAVLAAGLTACDGDGGGKTHDGQPTAPANDRSKRLSDLLTFLKGGSDGAHVSSLELREDKKWYRVFVGTDLPVVPDGDTSDTGRATDATADRIARRAQFWIWDHRSGGVEIDGVIVNAAGYSDLDGKGTLALRPGPGKGPDREEADRYAAALLAYLRGTPAGAHVTKVYSEASGKLSELTLLTDLPADPGGGLVAPDGATALEAPLKEWAKQHPEHKFLQLFVLDRDYGVAHVLVSSVDMPEAYEPM